MDTTTTTTATSQDCSSPSSVNMNNNNNNVVATTVDDSCNDPGKMFIGGLSWQTSQESLKAYFEKYGEVKEAMVLKDPATKRSRGFGFVTYKDPSSVDRVLSNGPHCLDSKTVDPKVAVPRKTHPKHVTKTKKIFVGGLSNQTTLDDVKNYFKKYGTIEDAQIMMDRTTNRSRGFAFVTFSSEAVVDAVCELHFHDINSKMVEAKKAQPKEVMAATSGALTRGRGIAQRYVSAPYSIPQGTGVTGFLPAAAAAAAASYPALPAAYGRSYAPPMAPGFIYSAATGSASQMDLAFAHHHHPHHPQQDQVTYIQVSSPPATSFATAPMAMPPALGPALSHNGVHAGAATMAGMANGGMAGASANAAPMAAGLAAHSALPNGAIPAANGLTGLAGPGPLPMPPFTPVPFQFLPFGPYPGPPQGNGY